MVNVICILNGACTYISAQKINSEPALLAIGLSSLDSLYNISYNSCTFYIFSAGQSWAPLLPRSYSWQNYRCWIYLKQQVIYWHDLVFHTLLLLSLLCNCRLSCKSFHYVALRCHWHHQWGILFQTISLDAADFRLCASPRWQLTFISLLTGYS